MSVTEINSERWLTWYRWLIGGLTGAMVVLLGVFGSLTIAELKSIRAEQNAFNSTLTATVEKVTNHQAQLNQSSDRINRNSDLINDLARRTAVLEDRGRR